MNCLDYNYISTIIVIIIITIITIIAMIENIFHYTNKNTHHNPPEVNVILILSIQGSSKRSLQNHCAFNIYQGWTNLLILSICIYNNIFWTIFHCSVQMYTCVFSFGPSAGCLDVCSVSSTRWSFLPRSGSFIVHLQL